MAAGIARGKSAKSIGVRAGNWLSVWQAQALLNAPEIAITKGPRDRAIIALVLCSAGPATGLATLIPTPKLSALLKLLHEPTLPGTTPGVTLRWLEPEH